ncbi:MAG: flavodoxin, partial [Clostridiales bacterium]|nr:flavodoxin [Clostridiales bacterium]
KIDFEKYDTIIYGGGLYANKVNGIKFISSNAEDLSGKALVIFTTGISDPTLAQNAQKILKSVNKALPKPFRSRAHVFSFRGGIDYSELGFMHRTMMSMLKKSIEKKRESARTDDEKMILEYYGKVCDMTDTSTAVPLIEYVKSLK